MNPRRLRTVPVAGRFRTGCTACPGVVLRGITRHDAYSAFLAHCEAEHMDGPDADDQAEPGEEES